MHIKWSYLAVAGALALAGCGGSGDSASESASEPPETTAADLPPADSEADRTAGGESEPDGGDSSAEQSSSGVRHLSPSERAREVALVRDVVRKLLDATNARDESVCTRLFDQHLVEPGTRDEAVDACKRGIADQPGGLELVKIESVRVREKDSVREALVQFLARQQNGRTARFGFHLIGRDGGYRIDRRFEVDQPGAG